MAEVMLACVDGAEGFSRRVAIKRVLAEHSANPEFARLFVKEARITSRLRHPNIVDVLDFDRDDEGRLFLAMELVEGVDLKEVLRSGALPLAVIIHVATGVLRGLGYAHQLSETGSDGRVRHLGIVHRDVSPQNVLVSWDGHVKLSDFGVATATSASQVTNWGVIKGKPTYMSPEQVQGMPLDGRSDLFAIGIILHEMLTGRPLFRNGQIAEVIGRVLNQPIAPPRTLRPEVPADIEAVTMRLLERDLGRRYAAAADALEDLLACRDASNRGSDLLAALLTERFANRAPVSDGAEGLARSDKAATHVQVPRRARSPAPELPSTLPFDEGEPPAERVDAPATPQTPATVPLRATPPALAMPTIRRRALLPGLAAAAALALAVGLTWLLDGSGATMGPAQDAVAGVDDERTQPADGHDASLAHAGADVAHAATRGAMDGGAPTAIDAAPRPAAPAPPAPATQGETNEGRDPPRRSEGQEMGHVTVAVTPWAEVYLRGELRGYAPTTLELPVGRHTLRLTNPDTGHEERVRVRVRANRRVVVERDW